MTFLVALRGVWFHGFRKLQTVVRSMSDQVDKMVSDMQRLEKERAQGNFGDFMAVPVNLLSLNKQDIVKYFCPAPADVEASN